MLYMRARYYSPTLCRFINADVLVGSVDESATLNRYAYANGNPVMNVDPLGLMVTRDGGVSYVPKTPRERKLWMDEQKIQMAEYKQLMQRISGSNEEPVTSYMPDWWNTVAKVVVGAALVTTAVLVVVGTGGVIATIGLGMAVSGAIGGHFNEQAGGNYASGAVGGAVGALIQGSTFYITGLSQPQALLAGGVVGSAVGTYTTQWIDNCFAPDNMKKTHEEMVGAAIETALVAVFTSAITAYVAGMTLDTSTAEALMPGGWTITNSNWLNTFFGAIDDATTYILMQGESDVGKNNHKTTA